MERDRVNVTVATTPLDICVEFIPHRTQVERPLPALHETDLLAAVAAPPAAMLIAEKSAGE